ncbi:phosphomevalonate kinase [Streptococcus plurextorum]|uniref:phosphomevalonate kinase n=1 Tax=Streptococcus plurextorum TaxID=456876 RepID=UPI00040DBB16|nr:phosphomevalonate kinase [Streptococcus plurextorum]
MITRVKTGGKLYIAGEYSVLTPGQTAIIKHIPMYMTATVEDAEQTRIKSDMFDYAVDMRPDRNYALIQESIRTLQTYSGDDLPAFSLAITGKLERDGVKYGIGSSGSVTVLVIKALAQHFGIGLSLDLLFKLASYTLLKLGDNGSMGDIACIAYQDLVAYTSFDRQNIAELIREKTLEEVIALDWGYQIERLLPSLKADFLVGWTKEPAISKDMINQALSAINQDFLEKTQLAVKATRDALLRGDVRQLKSSLQEASDQLTSLSSGIYSHKLKELKEAEVGIDVIAKSSGAGGGDCGVAFSFSARDTEGLLKRWSQAGIELLYEERQL